METNFFTVLSAFGLQGDWIITVRQENPDFQTVSVLFKDAKCDTPATKMIQPLIFKACPSKIDCSFFDDLNAPIVELSGALTNMEYFLKSVEQAKVQAKSQDSKTPNKVDARTESEKKYDNALKKVDELEAEGKFRDAWMKVPEISEYPEKEDFLRQRRESLSAQFPPSLFNL